MHYGHQPHVRSDEDLTVHYCRMCGWRSKEYARGERKGVPFYCEGICGTVGAHWVTFHPSERTQAEEILRRYWEAG